MPNPIFAIVIPAYNEEATIHDLVIRSLAISNIVIVVDDGSTDSTLKICRDLPITLIHHASNQGKAASLWAGINEAKKHSVEYIVTIDADGQHAPEDIPKLLEKSHQCPNHIIIGARLADKSAIPKKRYYANRIANFWIAWAAGYPIQDSQSGFRLYPVRLFDNLDISTDKNKSFVFESEILIKAARKNILSSPVPIPAVYAANARPSHFRGVRDITFITLMVGKTLFKNFFYPYGLYHSALRPHLPLLPDKSIDTDAITMFLLSTFIILLSGGITLGMSLLYVIYQAIYTTTSSLKGSILLVFGKRLQDNKPDSEYQLRLKRASQLLQSKHNHDVLVLGGITGNASISESEAGKKYLLAQGIQEDKINVEGHSKNSLENLREAIQLFDYQQRDVTLISNRYHLARICTMARGFGLSIHRCAAENHFHPTPLIVFRVFIEAMYIHWYLTGKYWAIITHNKRMLKRIRN